jgi:hypothetical protein
MYYQKMMWRIALIKPFARARLIMVETPVKSIVNMSIPPLIY